MQYGHKAQLVGIFGSQGSGKTTWALRFLANSPAKVRWLFDYEGEFADRLNLTPCRTPEEIAQAIATGWVCYDPEAMFPDDDEAALCFFCELAFKYSEAMPGRKIFVVDELQDYITSHRVPRQLRNIVRRGRRRGIDCVFMAQEPNSVHNLIQGQLTEVCCFQTITDNALAFLKEFGFDPAEVAALPEFRWICRNKRGAEARG